MELTQVTIVESMHLANRLQLMITASEKSGADADGAKPEIAAGGDGKFAGKRVARLLTIGSRLFVNISLAPGSA